MAYRRLFDSALARIDPERAHHRLSPLVRAAWVAAPAFKFEAEPVEVMGVQFPHRFGLAAGFDKNAEAVRGLLALGFGHVEIGTVTARAQPGNPKPRLFRLLDDEAIVNRMGFNNVGAAEVASRLHRLRSTTWGRDAVVGVNIGKTKATDVARAVDDYAESARLLAPYASYLVVNVSSPNTPGLRDLQAIDSLRPILTAVRDISSKSRHTHGGSGVPLVVKIAPDLIDDDVDAVADLALELHLDGISAANTTIARPDSLKTDRATVNAAGAGGLSGPILAGRATEMVTRLRGRVDNRLALIGVGGITTAGDARTRVLAGADLIQGYTGFIYGGPRWPSQLAAATTGLAVGGIRS